MIGNVNLGDNEIWSIKGSGTEIKMNDEIITNFEFWYVPNLWKNLISLGTLAKIWLKHSGEDDWVKTLKGSLVLMEAKLKHVIYFLEGNSVTCMVAYFESLEKHDDKS